MKFLSDPTPVNCALRPLPASPALTDEVTHGQPGLRSTIRHRPHPGRPRFKRPIPGAVVAGFDGVAVFLYPLRLLYGAHFVGRDSSTLHANTVQPTVNRVSGLARVVKAP